MSDVALRFGATDDGLDAKFAKTNKQLKDFESGASKVAAAVGGTFGKLATIVGGVSLAKLTAEAVQFADSLVKTQAQTGISVEALQSLQFIAGQTSVSFESITRAVNLFQRQLVEGGDAAQKALGQLGLSIQEIDRLAPDQQFAKIAEGISSVEDPAQRTALAMQIFGRSGADLLPMLTQTGEQITDLNARFEQLGGPVSAEAVSKLDDMGDSFDALKGSAFSLGVELLSLVAGPIKLLTDGLGSAVGELRNLGADIQFLTSGGSQSEELRFVERQIAQLKDLNGLQKGVANVLAPGKFDDRLQALEHQAAAIRAAQEMSRGLELQGFGGTPTMPALPTPFATGPRQPTPQELRLQSQQEGEESPFMDIGLQMQEQNQTLLDEMIRQDTEAMAQRIQIASDGALAMMDLRQMVGIDEIQWEQNKTGSILGLSAGMFDALAQHNTKYAKVAKAMAIAESLWNTYTSVTEALKLPWPLNLAVAASVGAMGMAQVAKIKSTNYGGGGGGGGSVSAGGGSSMGGSRASASQDTNTSQDQSGIKQQGVIQVIVTGDTYGFDDFGEKVVRAIQENVNDKDVVIINPSSRQALELAPVPA